MRNKSILILILGLITLASFASELATKAKGLKNGSLRPQSELLLHTKKMLPPVEIEIKNPNESPAEKNVPFTLDATVRVSRDLSAMNYLWKLPPGVIVSSGSSAFGTLKNLAVDENIILSTTFISSTNSNEKIHLLLWSDDPNNKINVSAQYNTQDQEAINNSKHELVERQNEYLLDNPDLLKHSK